MEHTPPWKGVGRALEGSVRQLSDLALDVGEERRESRTGPCDAGLRAHELQIVCAVLGVGDRVERDLARNEGEAVAFATLNGLGDEALALGLACAPLVFEAV